MSCVHFLLLAAQPQKMHDSWSTIFQQWSSTCIVNNMHSFRVSLRQISLTTKEEPRFVVPQFDVCLNVMISRR